MTFSQEFHLSILLVGFFVASELAICWLMAPAPFWSPQRLGGNSLGIVVSKAGFKPGPLLRMEVNPRKLVESAKKGNSDVGLSENGGLWQVIAILMGTTTFKPWIGGYPILSPMEYSLQRRQVFPPTALVLLSLILLLFAAAKTMHKGQNKSRWVQWV